MGHLVSWGKPRRKDEFCNLVDSWVTECAAGLHNLIPVTNSGEEKNAWKTTEKHKSLFSRAKWVCKCEEKGLGSQIIYWGSTVLSGRDTREEKQTKKVSTPKYRKKNLSDWTPVDGRNKILNLGRRSAYVGHKRIRRVRSEDRMR